MKLYPGLESRIYRLVRPALSIQDKTIVTVFTEARTTEKQARDLYLSAKTLSMVLKEGRSGYIFSSLSLFFAGLASRILQVGPVGSKFLGPVLIEMPHVSSMRQGRRETAILRCDSASKGKWVEHLQDENGEKLLKVIIPMEDKRGVKTTS